MNTTASLSDHLWVKLPQSSSSGLRDACREPSGRLGGFLKHYVLAGESPLNSDDDRESVLSIQAKETDFVRDTSDTSYYSDDVEFEPATESEDEQLPVDCASDDSSGNTDNEIISTKVISVAVLDEGDLEFADSEDSNESETDPEMELTDYWQCAQCRNPNNDPRYRYCEKCFKVRKNFFPPRPKRKSYKQRKDQLNEDLKSALEKSLSGTDSSDVQNNLEVNAGSRSYIESGVYTDPGVHKVASVHADPGVHTDSGVEPGFSQELESQELPCRISTVSFKGIQVPPASISDDPTVASEDSMNIVTEAKENATNTSVKSGSNIVILGNRLKRKAESLELEAKRRHVDYSNAKDDNLCIVCCTEPKSGVFVHRRIAHICCCYKCAVKVWVKAKRCPVCNCKVSNVLKVVVM